MPERGERPGDHDLRREPPPEAGLTASLWLVASVLAIVELIAWFSHRLFGA